MEKKLLEERALKQKVENRLLEAEKQRSMLDCDLKQSQQKINELLRQKDILNEDVRNNDKRILWNLVLNVFVFSLLYLYLGMYMKVNGSNFYFSFVFGFKFAFCIFTSLTYFGIFDLKKFFFWNVKC